MAALHAAAAAANNKKKQFDIENVPTPKILFEKMSCEHKAIVLASAQQACLAHMKSEVTHFFQIAELIKKDIDKKLGSTYHCIVGTHFGAWTEFEHLLYMSIGKLKILLFKHG
jgi:dynein light chain LC8-type